MKPLESTQTNERKSKSFCNAIMYGGGGLYILKGFKKMNLKGCQ